MAALNEYKAITAAQAAAQAEFNSAALAAALAVALNSIHSNLQLRLNFEAGPARAPLPHHAAPPKKKKAEVYSQLKFGMT